MYSVLTNTAHTLVLHKRVGREGGKMYSVLTNTAHTLVLHKKEWEEREVRCILY